MDCMLQILQVAITTKDFTLYFQKILIINMDLDIGSKKLMSEETFSTTQNYYRRNQMSKGKDISTMFTREENKKNGRLGYGLATREKEDVISPAQYGAFLQKRGRRK